ncbi:hypothetical protein HED60_15075 [Planctomycetales bacterium ZRK34]|nr:hypothetical protein HED60_15075 [Planctomycetales bacterium ZRK34]
MHWTLYQTRDDYQRSPVSLWTYEECMDWLIAEGCYSCAADVLTPDEAREEVALQIKAIDWKPPCGTAAERIGMIITPTIGRIVYFFKHENQTEIVHDEGHPLAAMITHVWHDRMVNLTVFDSNGQTHGVTSVDLRQPEDPSISGRMYCEWMPYQVKKDHGSESGEKPAGTEKI